MSDAAPSQSLSSDIAFIRAMVEEGHRTPFRGGVSLLAGLVWGSASLYCWTVASGLWNPFGYDSMGWVWLVAAIVFALSGIPLGIYRARPGSNRMAAAVWGAVGISCWTISAAIILAAVRTHVWAIFAILPPVIMATYGGAWFVSATAFRAPWQRWISILSVLSSLALAWLAAQPLEYLLFALSLYGLAGLPGLVAILRAQSNA